jgi:hypothetical protein
MLSVYIPAMARTLQADAFAAFTAMDASSSSGLTYDQLAVYLRKVGFKCMLTRTSSPCGGVMQGGCTLCQHNSWQLTSLSIVKHLKPLIQHLG